MLDRILRYSFYLLFGLTPLIWLPATSELFEFNKMVFVYLMTVVVATAWFLKMVSIKTLLVKRTPLDIPLLLFLLANILSTIFSIDPHTSIWGYYSRLNGGLVSIISYTVLYYALVSNLHKEEAVNTIKAALLGGVAVALYAIPEHFGASPSCLILHGRLTASCWVQDVQARVFATLGQPNWLAAYLAMLIFPALYFALTAANKRYSILYTLYSILFYLALTFTYSRGGTLGFLAGLVVLGAFLLIYNLPFHLRGVRLKPQILWVGVILGSFIAVNLLFGSALTEFTLIKKAAPPPRPGISLDTSVPSGTQLESGGTESGKIRLIVWKGAWEIFKHYPILGSGVETFAYSYYQFRPASHNLVSEWDFLYNKAHNEYLNYLANTGSIGFIAYMGIILTFVVWSLKIKNYQKTDKNSESINIPYQLLIVALLASYISYLVQNFFGFSVVIAAVFFYLFPALAFVLAGSAQPLSAGKIPGIQLVSKMIFKRSWYRLAVVAAGAIISLSLIVNTTRIWLADFFYAQGSDANESSNPGRAYNLISLALRSNSGEPLYKSDLGYAAAGAAVALSDTDATLSAELKKEAVSLTEEALASHPKNVSYLRTAVRTYFLLSTADRTFISKSLDVLDRAIKAAPTDPKLTYNKAVILGQESRDELPQAEVETRTKQAVEALEKTIELKPNYRDAHFALGLYYYQQGRKEQAVEQMKAVLKIIPDDAQAADKLKQWQ